MGVLENVFYIVILLLFVSTFLPKPIRARVRESLGELWRALPHLWRAIEPYAYRVVTGKEMPADDREDLPAQIESRGDLHREVEREFPLPTAENDDLHGGVEAEEAAIFAPATEEEIRQLAVALRHNLTTEDKTKSGAIKAGWGVARSGSDPRYQRASELYDLATKLPAVGPVYRDLDEDQRTIVGKRNHSHAKRKATREVETA